MNTETEQANTLDYCRNLPRPPKESISRDHLIEEIKRTLEGRADIVLLTGEPLTGKSELAAEYFRRHSSSAIGVFLSPELGLFKSADYIRLTVAEQISWLVDHRPMNEDVISEELYRRYLYKLQKLARKTPVTWVVDGLLQGSGPDHKQFAELTETLPLSTRDFNFIITSETDVVGKMNFSNRAAKRMDVIPVSPDEARRFFQDLLTDPRDAEEIRTFCLSSIGRMQRMRNLLNDGQSIQELLRTRNESLDAIFDYEWRLLGSAPDLHRALGFIVYSPYPLTLAELVRLSSIPEARLQDLVKDCRLLKTRDSDAACAITIESRALRNFVARRVQEHEEEIRQVFVADLLRRPDSDEALQFLPAQMAKVGLNSELINKLDAQHFAKVLESQRSLKALRQHAEFGCQASRALEDHASEIAFSLISSAFTGLTFSVATDDHIAVLVELGSTDAALELASISPTAEERLHYLAVAAKALRKKAGNVPSHVREQIAELIEQVDPQSLGELAVDISTELVGFDPKLASRLMQKVLAAPRSFGDESPGKEEATEEKRPPLTSAAEMRRNRSARISKEKLREYHTELARFFEATPSELLLQQLAKEKSEVALELAKQWLVGNRSSPGRHKVADAALDYLLACTGRTPTLQDLRVIAGVLPSLDLTEREHLLGRLETQFRVLGHHGTNSDVVRLRMRLAAAKYDEPNHDVELALIDLDLDIHKIEDLAAKATCWAWFLHHLNRFPNREILEDHTGLKKDAADHLAATIQNLLQSSADHFEVAKSAIGAMARSDSRQAFKLCSCLNTRESRDKAYQELARLLVPRYDSESEMIVACIGAIHESFQRNEVIMYILSALRREGSRRNAKPVPSQVLDLWKQLGVAVYKVQAIAYVCKIKHREGNTAEVGKLVTLIEDLWEHIHSHTNRVHAGYHVARELAAVDPDLTQAWLRKIAALVQARPLPSEPLLDALHYTMRIATRLFPGVYSAQDAEGRTNVLRRLTGLINSLQDCESELRLWSDVAVRLHYAGYGGIAKSICEEHVWSLMNQGESNVDLQAMMAMDAAPALYLAHPARAKHLINELPTEHRDSAITFAARVLLTHIPHREPYQLFSESEFSLTPETVFDLLELAKDIKTDSVLFLRVSELCRSISATKNLSKLQRNAVVDFLRKLEELVRRALPDPGNIQHEGFLIACLAKITNARNIVQHDSMQRASPQWEELFERTRRISNAADRAVVTAIVGADAKAKPGSNITGWLDLVKSDVGKIPSMLDRIDRYEWIARIVSAGDKAGARTLVMEGMRLSNLLPSSDDLQEQQRSLLDLAHSIDSDLGEQVLRVLDADEARREPLRKRLESHTKRKELAKNPNSADFFSLDDDQVSEVCRENLGSLNAHRIPVKPVEEFLQLNRRAKQMPVAEAYWAWAWIAENAYQKSRNASDKLCGKLFDAALKAFEIGQALVGRMPLQHASDAESGTIRAGDRELFMARLQEWAQSLGNHVTIYVSDPYFSPDDLEVVRAMSEAAPAADFRILTGKEQMKKRRITEPEDAFRDGWEMISDVEPPFVEVCVIGFGPEGKHPIHDRWIVTAGGGLSLGSSVNSMGFSRVSDLSTMTKASVDDKHAEIERFFLSPPRTQNGQRLSSTTFRL